MPGVLAEPGLSPLRDAADALIKAGGDSRGGARDALSQGAEIGKLAGALTATGYTACSHIPVRGIVFDKTAQNNWPVAWHQALTISVDERREVEGYGPWSEKGGLPHVQPPTSLLEDMVTLRLHLDDTPEDNGALRVAPGTHLQGRIPSEEAGEIARRRAPVTCACRAGDLLVMRPLLLHASSKSISPTRRRVIHIEYAPADALAEELRWRTIG